MASLVEKGKKCLNKRNAKVADFMEEYKTKFPSANKMKDITTNYPTLSSLRSGLDSKKFSCKELVLTYIHETATKGMALNACADIMFKEAVKEAEDCDQELKRGKTRGFLHGIPISFKDQVLIKNTL